MRHSILRTRCLKLVAATTPWIGNWRQPGRNLPAVGCLYDDREDVVRGGLLQRRKDNLAAVVSTVLRKDLANAVIAAPVAANRIEYRCDVFHRAGNAEGIRHEASQLRAVVGGLAL